MRLFTALLPPAHVLDGTGQLADKVAELRALDGSARLRWTDRANWHVTLAFYGEVDDAEVDALRERLARAAARARPLRLRIAGGGHFGDRALWAGITGAGPAADSPHDERGPDDEHGTDGRDAEGLGRLAATTAAAGRRLGLGPDEPGRFRAHLTLARSRKPGLDLRPYTTVLDRFTGRPWTASELALVRSNLPEGGTPGEQPRYERIAGWPLGG